MTSDSGLVFYLEPDKNREDDSKLYTTILKDPPNTTSSSDNYRPFRLFIIGKINFFNQI